MTAALPALSSFAAVLGMSALLVALGSAVRPTSPDPGGGQLPYRWAVRGVAGAVLVYLLLLGLHLLSVEWRPAVILALAAALWWILRRWTSERRSEPRVQTAKGARRPLAPGWGDAVAIGCLAVLIWVALHRWSVHPDLIYHWGLKARRFALLGGIDTELLARPWNLSTIHPAYPHLVPALFAFTTRLLGGYQEAAMVLWTAPLYAAMLAAARQIASREGCSAFGIQSTLALTAVATLMAGVSLQILGGPDWILAALPLLAWPALQRPGVAADRAIGWIAALGAGAKMEGIAMGIFLVGLYAVVRWRAARSPIAGSPRERDEQGAGQRGDLALLLGWMVRVGLPSVLVLLPWWWIGSQHDLFGHSYRGALAPQWTGVIFATVLERLRLVSWHGLGWIVMLLPAFLLPKRSRAMQAIGCLLLAQLAFYLFAYFASPYESAEAVRVYVRSNFPRLAFHLVPTLLVGLGVLLDRGSGRDRFQGEAG